MSSKYFDMVCDLKRDTYSGLGFQMGRDSATFQDKGTEDPLLSQDKGTMG